MAIVFSGMKESDDCELVPPNTRHLRENVWRKRPELWGSHNWLHHDMPAHFIIPHPPYSQDLAPCEIASFPKLKTKLQGCCFEAVPHTQRESQVVLNSIMETGFCGAFEV
jgi:hypothetical protein